MNGADDRLSLARKIALGSGDLASNLYWQSTTLFLLYFYTDVLKLPAAVAGAVYMIALVWDGAIDPVVGWIADRTRTRLGRYRPYLLFGAPCLALSYVAMFLPPAEPAGDAVLIVAGTHLIFRTCFAIVGIPYSSMFARVTRDSAQRADLAAARIVFAMIAGVIVSSATLPLSGWLGGGNARHGWQMLAVCYAAVAMLMTWFVAGVARGLDRPEPPVTVHHARAMIWRSIIVNRPLQLALGVVLVSSFSATFFSKNIIYYFKYIYGDAAAATPALTLSAAVTGLSVPFWTWVIRRRGKRFAWATGTALVAVGTCGWWLANGHGLPALMSALALVAFGSSAGYICFWAVLPDTVEYGEWRTGVRTEALVFGLVVLGQKSALGIAAGALGVALQQIGYQADTPMSAATSYGLRMLMIAVPLIGSAISLLLIAFYRLDFATHARMVRDIAEREDAASAGPAR